MSLSFSVGRLPRLVFGEGCFELVPALAGEFGKNCLVVTGSSFFDDSDWKTVLAREFASLGMDWKQVRAVGEPAPETVNQIVAASRSGGNPPDVVVGIGGGSAIDLGKAISAMLPVGKSVEAFLEIEGGGREHPGTKVPFLAVPTTAGTGSEATKNAVLGVPGRGGFKASLRHENFVPDVAVVDPSFLRSCPRPVLVACGMDALTQLIESYVSTRSSPFTDALSVEGMQRMGRSLRDLCADSQRSQAARDDVALAAYLSGAALASAGLGVVHGIAPILGAWFGISHGTACGTLLASATEENIQCLRAQGELGALALDKYTQAARCLLPQEVAPEQEMPDLLVEALGQWTVELGLPKLGELELTETDLPSISGASGLKANPCRLDPTQITRLLRRRL